MFSFNAGSIMITLGIWGTLISAFRLDQGLAWIAIFAISVIQTVLGVLYQEGVI